MVICKDSNYYSYREAYDSYGLPYGSWVINLEKPDMEYEEICECVLDWLLKRGIVFKPAFLSFSINKNQKFNQTAILLIDLMRILETTNLFKEFKTNILGVKSSPYNSLKVDFSIRNDGNAELEKLFDISKVFADSNSNTGVIYNNASDDELEATKRFIEALNALSDKLNHNRYMAKIPYLHLTYNSAKENLDDAYAHSFKGGICTYGRKIIICANSNKYYALLEAMGNILDNNDVDMDLIESMENKLRLKVK